MYDIMKNHGNVGIQKLDFLIISLSIFLLVGCTTPAAYREPITQFQQASTVVIESTKTEYQLANKRERDAVIDRHVHDRKEITLKTIDDKEIRLLSPDDLAARMAALRALAKHGELLLALASSDAPTRAKDAANSLDDALIKLSSTLKNEPSDTFRNQASGFAAIAGEVTKLVLENKIREALDKAIISSEKNVLALIKILGDDMSTLYERQRTHLSDARVFATDEYNEELKKNANTEKLQTVALKIQKTDDAWNSLSLISGAGLDAMADAHKQLVDYAKSSKNPQDLAELVDAIDAFVTRATVIADAIKTIRKTEE